MAMPKYVLVILFNYWYTRNCTLIKINFFINQSIRNKRIIITMFVKGFSRKPSSSWSRGIGVLLDANWWVSKYSSFYYHFHPQKQPKTHKWPTKGYNFIKMCFYVIQEQKYWKQVKNMKNIQNCHFQSLNYPNWQN